MEDSLEQHRVWESIADSFDRSRTRKWPHVEEFLAGLPSNSLVLDLMAGNGRHTGSIIAAGHSALWFDWSRPSARIAAAKCPKAHVVCGDATRLPFYDHSIDACIFVAGLHCLLTPEARADSLRELHRVLRPGGTAQVTVWGRNAPRFSAIGTPGEPIDVVIPWRSDGHDEARTYHLYTMAALQWDAISAGFSIASQQEVAIVSRDVPDNLVATLTKPIAVENAQARPLPDSA